MDEPTADARTEALKARTARTQEAWDTSTARMDDKLAAIAQQIEQIQATAAKLDHPLNGPSAR